jgi:hypothetical protein
MLQPPPYITASGVCTSPVGYSWRPDQDVSIIEAYPKNIEHLVGDISLRASLTLGIGVAEWMMWRLDGRSAYNRVNLYINALWARTVDKLYLKVSHLEKAKDTGDPILGPLLALELALYGVLVKTTLDHPERGRSVAEMVSLVRYTLTDQTEFDHWLGLTLGRFLEHYRLNPKNRGGALVPRAFLDPNVAVDPSQVALFLDDQLRNVERVDNPFLATADEMMAAGFKGTPYRYLP